MKKIMNEMIFYFTILSNGKKIKCEIVGRNFTETAALTCVISEGSLRDKFMQRAESSKFHCASAQRGVNAERHGPNLRTVAVGAQ